MRMALAALVLLCAGAGGQAEAADRLPAAMLGKWASDPEACKEQSSELGMTVEPRSVLFYEHGYEIKRLARQSDGSWKGWGYSVDDQGRAQNSITLKLVGDRLQARGQMYYRCLAGQPARPSKL